MTLFSRRIGTSGLLFLAILIPGTSTGAGQLQCVDVATLFVAPNEPVTLVWRYSSAEKPTTSLRYTVRDYMTRTVATGTAPIDKAGKVSLTLKLQRGYYDIAFPDTEQQFGVVAIRQPSGTPDPFFCIDGALSWLVPNSPLRAALVKGLRRCGIAMVRERLRWEEIQPTPGKWRWDGFAGVHGYDTLRRQLVAADLPALEVCHDAPAWIGRVEKYPDDLIQTARSWTTIARHWHSAWGAIEVWNEPDIFFGGNLPGDQYAAVVKTLAWARRQANVKAQLVGGVVAHFDPDYQQCVARNGMLDLVDAASFHTYGHADSVQNLVARFRRWVGEFSYPEKPLWLTECGRPWKKGHARPDPAQDKESALDITMKAVEARACGVARYFAFVYPYYEERDNNFGMMGRAGTPLRSMAAYAQCIAQLSGLSYLGDLACRDTRLKRARLFGDDQRAVLVLYTGKPDPKAVVDVGFSEGRVLGIDGRPLQRTSSSLVPIPDGLAYLLVDRHVVKSRLKRDTAARKLYAAAHGKMHKPQAAAPIVVRYQYDAKLVDAKTQGYRVRTALSGPMTFTCRIFNLASQPCDLVVKLQCRAAPGIVLGSAAHSIRLNGETHQDIVWKIDLGKALKNRSRLTVAVIPESAAGGKIMPTVVTFMK